MTGRKRLTAGKVHIVHMCGKLRGLFAGDALRQIGELIIGGLDPAYLAAAGADECGEYALQQLLRIPAKNLVEGPVWQYDEAAGEYYLHLFAPNSPT